MAQHTPLRLYNTLTRQKETFTPIDPARVRMYVCGPTVYDFAHIGNARPIIVFDVLYRVLRHIYGDAQVTYVRNITDVDDKINARAAERGVTIRELTEETARIFHEDVAALGCLKPDVEPRATEHIAEMIQIIERLIAGGFAYVAEDHVLFSTVKMTVHADKLRQSGTPFPHYGELSNRSLREMIAGARVEVAPYKQAPTDFVLWKPSKPGEPGWTSPCGIATPGRPGWHIECSAMSWKHLGETFDIHGGGIDLVFPHHENEIAQSCCAFGNDVMANVWMHNGFLQVEGQKMSKSLGNFITINELLNSERFGRKRWSGQVLRLAMLRSHYHQPIDWTVTNLEASERLLRKWGETLAKVNLCEIDLDRNFEGAFWDALFDDLNTPLAITEIVKLHDRARRNLSAVGASDVNRFVNALMLLGLDPVELARTRGLPIINANLSVTLGSATMSASASVGVNVSASQDLSAANNIGHVMVGAVNVDRVNELVAKRIAARGQKDFTESDRIRDELVAMGIQLRDGKGPGGELVTEWEIKR